ncbi:MAG: tetratricopeptide repeat protein, partial [Pseudomonadota bacterium]|nr:tetratricopeptide repeat protein [Pseudomonadota bacterium]
KGLFNLSQGEMVQGEKDLVAALNIAPEVLETRLQLCSLYLRQQNYQAAIEILQGGLDNTPSDALLYNYLAASYIAQKKPQEGLAALEKAKIAKPDYFTPYFNIASYYISKRDYEKAVTEYEAVLAVDDKNLKSLVAIGALSELSGDEEKARQYFQMAAATETPSGYLALAQYLLRSKKYDDVPALLEAALKAHPGHPAILELKGRLLAEKSGLAEAAPVFRELEKVRPGRGTSLMVAAYLKNGESDKAREMAEKVIEMAPQSAYGYLLLSSVQEREHEPPAALKTLQEGLKNVDRETPALKMRLGVIYEKMANYELAMLTYQEVKELLIPLDEVGVLLCNGRHVDFDRELVEGDICSIFPKIGGG